MRLIDADALFEHKVTGVIGNLSGDFVPGFAIAMAPTIEAEPVRHGKWVHVKKHLWHKRENGEVDEWVLDHGYHNGPGCEVCGASVCMHCNPDWAETECRIGYYVCSACEQPARTGNTNYCPHCGAKMDLKGE